MNKPEIKKAICNECNTQWGYDSQFTYLVDKFIKEKQNCFDKAANALYSEMNDDERYEVDCYAAELRQTKMENCLVISEYAICRYHLNRYTEKIYNN